MARKSNLWPRVCLQAQELFQSQDTGKIQMEGWGQQQKHINYLAEAFRHANCSQKPQCVPAHYWE